MAGLVPAIHTIPRLATNMQSHGLRRFVDGRVKPVHEGLWIDDWLFGIAAFICATALMYQYETHPRHAR
jgi:hypothetical protein